MVIKNCPHCGGEHWGSLRCPYLESDPQGNIPTHHASVTVHNSFMAFKGESMPEIDKASAIEDMLSRERYAREGQSMPSVQMPLYHCHKDVWALKIVDVIDPTQKGNESDGTRILTFAEKGYASKRVPQEYVRKHDPKPGGYYVVYKDGYASFSPADVFEEGYTRA